MIGDGARWIWNSSFPGAVAMQVDNRVAEVLHLDPGDAQWAEATLTRLLGEVEDVIYELEAMPKMRVQVEK